LHFAIEEASRCRPTAGGVGPLRPPTASPPSTSVRSAPTRPSPSPPSPPGLGHAPRSGRHVAAGRGVGWPKTTGKDQVKVSGVEPAGQWTGFGMPAA